MRQPTLRSKIHSNERPDPRRKRSVRGLVCACSLVWTALFAAAASAQAEVDVARAAKVKAAYLRYIAELTIWPDDVLGAAADPIVLGTVGSDPHGVTRILERAIERKGLRAQDRPIELRRLPALDDEGFEVAMGDCHLLFLSGSDGVAEHWTRLRDLLADRPIVTIGELAGFSAAQGMIEFVIDAEADRVTMHIDLEAVQRARLRLSSRLLGLKQGVKIVRTPLASDACATPLCRARSKLPSMSGAMRPGSVPIDALARNEGRRR